VPSFFFENEGVEICRADTTRIVLAGKQDPVLQNRLKTEILDGGLGARNGTAVALISCLVNERAGRFGGVVSDGEAYDEAALKRFFID